MNRPFTVTFTISGNVSLKTNEPNSTDAIDNTTHRKRRIAQLLSLFSWPAFSPNCLTTTTMENSSTIKKLHAPLLGVKPVEVGQERHQNIITADIPVLVDDDVDEQEENNQKDASQCWYNFFCHCSCLSSLALHSMYTTKQSQAIYLGRLSISAFFSFVWRYGSTAIPSSIPRCTRIGALSCSCPRLF